MTAFDSVINGIHGPSGKIIAGRKSAIAATPAPRYGPRTHPVRKQKA